MRIIIAGSRSVRDYQEVEDAIEEALAALDIPLQAITAIIAGPECGPDRLGAQWAVKHGIPVEMFPSRWGPDGNDAVHRNNERKADTADALIAVWDGESEGTMHMRDLARGRGMPSFVKNRGKGKGPPA